jgi:hypothetical protein
MNVVVIRKLSNIICSVGMVSVIDEQNGLPRYITPCCKWYERLLEPFETQEIVSPTLVREANTENTSRIRCNIKVNKCIGTDVISGTLSHSKSYVVPENMNPGGAAVPSAHIHSIIVTSSRLALRIL